LGEPTSPILAGLETYCLLKQQTVSEAVRDCITFTLLDKGLIEDKSGLLTKATFFKVGKLSKKAAKITLTEKGNEFRRSALEKTKSI
jgi:hypothetical protein